MLLSGCVAAAGVSYSAGEKDDLDRFASGAFLLEMFARGGELCGASAASFLCLGSEGPGGCTVGFCFEELSAEDGVSLMCVEQLAANGAELERVMVAIRVVQNHCISEREAPLCNEGVPLEELARK